MRPRSAALVLAAAVAAATLASCSSGGGATGGASLSACGGTRTRHAANQLVVEGDPWSGYASFRPPGGLLAGRLTYKEELDQQKRACDLTTGRADFEVTTIGQYLRTRPEGSIVGVIDQSQGADALVLNTHDHPYLKSVDWLPKLVAEMAAEGKKPVLAYTGGSPSEELLDELANTYEDFKPDQFDLVSVDQSQTAFDMLQSSKAQLAILWEPNVTAARNLGDVVAHSSKDVPGAVVDVLVAGNDLRSRDPATVQALVDAHYAFIDARLAKPADLTSFLAKDGNLTTDEAASVLGGIHFYGAKDANGFMNTDLFPLDEPQVRQSLKAIGSLVALRDPSLTVTEDMADGQYVTQAAGG